MAHQMMKVADPKRWAECNLKPPKDFVWDIEIWFSNRDECWVTDFFLVNSKITLRINFSEVPRRTNNAQLFQMVVSEAVDRGYAVMCADATIDRG
jgi:hypothetical protein